MIADVVTGIFKGAVKPLLDKWIPDADKRLEAEQLFFKQAQEISLGQIEVNKLEAQNSSIFVSGWRPFIGWVCGASLAYAMIGYTFFNWALSAVAPYTGHALPALPAPDTTITFELLMAMLGLGGMRSWEKFKGLTK